MQVKKQQSEPDMEKRTGQNWERSTFKAVHCHPAYLTYMQSVCMCVCVCVCVCVLLSCVRLFVTPWTAAHQAPLSIEFSRQEYWNGLPYPSPGDHPDPGIKPGSPALQADSLSLSHQGSSP